jgi:hypothetical protein
MSQLSPEDTMKLLGKRLLTFALLPLLLVMFVSITPPASAASSQKCTTHSTSHTFHDPDNTTAVVTQTITKCTDQVDDTYQTIYSTTYLAKYGYWGNWLFTWGIQEWWTTDLTTSTITAFQNPPGISWAQCCTNPDGQPAFVYTGASTSATQVDSQDIKATGSALVWWGVFTCNIFGYCSTLYYPYDSVSCTMSAHLTSPSGSCSG